MSEKFRAKVIVIGPPRVGKTLISNFLAGLSKTVTEDYHPTVGARILEFERDIVVPAKTMSSWQGNKKMEVELWDCSGDRNYEACWPAMIAGSKGAIIVFNPEGKNQDKEIENWYSRFIVSGNIKESNCLIFAHNSSGTAQNASKQMKFKLCIGTKNNPLTILAKGLSKVPMINTSVDYDADTIKFEFENLVNSLAKDILEKRDSEELNIINS